MALIRHPLLAAAAALLGLAAAVPAPVFAAAHSSGQSLTLSATNTGTSDQVTLAFTGPVPALTVSDSDNEPVGIGSGKPHPIGDSTHYVHLACPQGCWSGQITNGVPFEQLPQVRGAFPQSFEGELAIDIGLAQQAGYGVSTQGGSVIVTVQH
jgi:hypothetical protein